MAKSKKSVVKKKSSKWKLLLKKYSNINNIKNFLKNLMFDVNYSFYIAVFLLVVEFCLCVVIVEKVKYTEIDWKAYMQEVEGFLNGTLDYSKLKGDTGPLVYPAGFVYVYSFLYYLTDFGTNIKLAQYIFIALYLMTLGCVIRLYITSKKVPPFVLVVMCFTTYRIHSIYLLRLFNDPFASFFLYLCMNFFISGYTLVGSLLYSFAVSIKMNVLLFSPALLVFYLTSLGFWGTITQLVACALVQVILAVPFLMENPLAYIKGSFDLGRVFLHKWTVNWRFIPEEIFVSPTFHISLLIVHVLLLILFGKICYKYLCSYYKLKAIERRVHEQLKHRKETVDMGTCSQLFLFPMFTVNLIGIACSRSLHYQFYVWYYHTLPYLCWCTDLSVKYKLVLLGLIELCWNIYPSTHWSSLMLHCCHATLLYNLYKHNTKVIKDSDI